MKALAIVQQFYPDVKYIRDATKSLEIEVTDRDCQTAAVKKHRDCALAVACKHMATVDGAIVATSAAYLVRGDTATRYKVPASVAREIVSFDRSGEFYPGTYWLDKPFHKLGAPGASGSNQRRAKPKPKAGFMQLRRGIRADLRKAAAPAA